METEPVIPYAPVLRLSRSIGQNGTVEFDNNCPVCHSLEVCQNRHGPSLIGNFKRNPSRARYQMEQLIRSDRRHAAVSKDCRLTKSGTHCLCQNAVNAKLYDLMFD